ncbi:hypothetical protein AB0H82_32830 [Streptomyces sp. NPDC050732]|uniref:hypothetical protein n=1 Tax=Streptomyces sp. NPDC050732 TaxID=3154632 RepID=UPI003443F0D4
MTVQLLPAEALLALGADYNRHNDALHSLYVMEINGASPATAVSRQIPRTQHLAKSALHIIDALNEQPMYPSAGIRAVYARVRQLGHLALDATDHLLDAEDILDDIRVGAPSQDRLPLTAKEAREEVRGRLVLIQNLTALGADDTLAAAELLTTEMRQQRLLPAGQSHDLSPAQHAALRAVAQGFVTIDRHDNKPRVSHDDLRVSISTIRSLEARGLLNREETPRILHDERVHLTAEGCRTLAASFGRSRSPALTTARPAQPRAGVTPARSR